MRSTRRRQIKMELLATGARAARSRMKALGRLPMASKCWEPGDRVLFVFPVFQTTPEGYPDFPVGEKYGHAINLPDDSKFGRSFVTTTIDEFDERGKPVGEDFLQRLSSLSFALRKGHYERKVEQETRDSPNPEALKAALKALDDAMKNYRPIVGALQLKVAVEVFVAKLDVNGRLKDGKMDFTHAIMNISPTKFDSLLSLSEKAGGYIEGTNYFYVEMETDAAKKKNEAGQADWRIPANRLEEAHPEFQGYVQKMVGDADIRKEDIEAHFYDFQPYNVNELKAELASTINSNLYLLKKIDNSTYHEHVKNPYVIDALEEVNLTADANFIKSLIDDNTVAPETMVNNLEADMNAQAQTISMDAQPAQAQSINPAPQTITQQPAQEGQTPKAVDGDPFASAQTLNS